ncbi:YggT family protein [Marmoricola endophyticus]|uniref:YggT family protein n=1 Tax=Marmoricola endophyticus TaxID=2040280 RepID=A0A917F138_9ACTN|nr:YggT family protein [Marmoricola endophyticus]GGF37870.1 YggT family protein [Marmoricola endophyticus]
MLIVGQIIAWALGLFVFLLLVRFVMDWVQLFARDWRPRGIVLALLEIVYSITDPPIKAVRKVLPMVRLGGMGLDLSPMVVLIVCLVLQRVNGLVFLSGGL